MNLETGADALLFDAPVLAARTLARSTDSGLFVTVAESGLRIVSRYGASPISEGLDRLSTSSTLSIARDRDVVAMGSSGSFAPFDVQARTSEGGFAPVSMPESGGLFVGLEAGIRLFRALTSDFRTVSYEMTDGEATALDTDSWPEIACRAAGSDLTEDEWAQWGPKDEPYRQVCS